MCNTYTIILKCNHKQHYTHRCPSYLRTPREKCVEKPRTIAHYFANCRKCQGQAKDNFVVEWVENTNNSAVDVEEGSCKKGEDSNYMLGTGRFDIVANGDQRVREKGVRVYQDGTEEARREKKGLRQVFPNVLDVSTSNPTRFHAENDDDMYSQTNESVEDIGPAVLRTQSLPIKGKQKKPSVLGSLRKMIVRPKSEQDTAATGEHKSPTQGIIKPKLDRFNTIASGIRGGKKAKGLEDNNSLPGSTDERKVDEATGYEYLTPKEFLDLHFMGVVAGTGGAEALTSNATSTPINIPQKQRPKAPQEFSAERHAGEYMDEIGHSPFADKSVIDADFFTGDFETDDVEDSHHGGTFERWSHDTRSSRPHRMSRETEFSQSKEEQMDIIGEASDGEIINLTPHNIDDILTAWKGSFGTSSSSSPTHIPPRHRALDHPVHSHSTDALPAHAPMRFQGLVAAGHSASLPNPQRVGEKAANSQWAQEDVLQKVPLAHLQNSMDSALSPRWNDTLKRNNTVNEPHPQGFNLTKRSDTGNVRHHRHPLANEITQSNTFANTSQTHVSKPAVLKDRAGLTTDRLSTITTLSQFIPSRNKEQEEEFTAGVIPTKTSCRTPRHRLGSPNAQNITRSNTTPIPEVPAIPKTYAKHTTVLPKIGRDASGRFSVEHIAKEELGIPLTSEDEIISEETAGEASVDEQVDMYANHTIGTWDAVLRNSLGDVSPLSSVEDLKGVASPVSPLGKRGDGRGRAVDGDGDLFLSPESYHGKPDYVPQHIYPSTASPPQLPSTFSPSHQQASSMPNPPQARSPPPSLLPVVFNPNLQQPQTLPSAHIAQQELSPTDPTIPITRPLQIRKKNQPLARSESESENAREILAQRRQQERMEEEFRRADERLRGLRDGRGAF